MQKDIKLQKLCLFFFNRAKARTRAVENFSSASRIKFSLLLCILFFLRSVRQFESSRFSRNMCFRFAHPSL